MSARSLWLTNSEPLSVDETVESRLRCWGATAIFDEYWRFAVRRQEAFRRRIGGKPPPWTDDSILERYRFTNAYRVCDRVTQFLIAKVLFKGPQEPEDIVFRCLLFKIFNRISTWERLVDLVGEPRLADFTVAEYAAALSTIRREGQRIYSAAYIMPSPRLGAATKHENHLRLLATVTSRDNIDRLLAADSVKAIFSALREVPSFGPFLAFQFSTDLNYTNLYPYGEDSFVVAGPGAVDGLAKCFSRLPAGQLDDVIMWTCETQEYHLGRLGLQFPRIAGRPLQPVDCQNLFCEVSKYTRAAYPGAKGVLGRTRIKQTYSSEGAVSLPPLVLPPKWVGQRSSTPVAVSV